MRFAVGLLVFESACAQACAQPELSGDRNAKFSIDHSACATLTSFRDDRCSDMNMARARLSWSRYRPTAPPERFSVLAPLSRLPSAAAAAADADDAIGAAATSDDDDDDGGGGGGGTSAFSFDASPCLEAATLAATAAAVDAALTAWCHSSSPSMASSDSYQM